MRYQRLAWWLAVTVVIESSLLTVLLAHALALEAGPHPGWMTHVLTALIIPGFVLHEAVRPGVGPGSWGYGDWMLAVAGSWALLSAVGVALLRYLFFRAVRLRSRVGEETEHIRQIL